MDKSKSFFIQGMCVGVLLSMAIFSTVLLAFQIWIS